MSYIRYGQSGQYVDIPGGSQFYIFDNGETINGTPYEKFAYCIGSLVEELDYDCPQDIESGFAEYFDGYDESFDGGLPAPERAEIFCQCVDSRIDSLELTDELHEAVRTWVEDEFSMLECHYCGNEFRPTGLETEPYICSDSRCFELWMEEQ